jgi:hypothetical protein
MGQRLNLPHRGSVLFPKAGLCGIRAVCIFVLIVKLGDAADDIIRFSLRELGIAEVSAFKYGL